jgi:hypothetical protein
MSRSALTRPDSRFGITGSVQKFALWIRSVRLWIDASPRSRMSALKLYRVSPTSPGDPQGKTSLDPDFDIDDGGRRHEKPVLPK